MNEFVSEKYEPFANELAEKIKKRRAMKDWSQEELAEKIGKSRSYIAYIEQSRRIPSTKTLHDIAEAFGVKVATLLRD